jgi:RNA polymerase sigma-70 factor (ECF subfamily)
VSTAARPDHPETRAALSLLCDSYWKPIHAYVRRLGYPEEDAKDLTQEFFLRLISKNVFAAADRTKGRFRTFLLTGLNFFLANEYHRGKAAKRGGGQVLASLDEETEDKEPVHQPASGLSPAAVYEQTWARTVFGEARDRLAEEYAAAGKQTVFKHLQEFLEGTPDPRGYHPVAAVLRMTPNAVGVAVHRMRQRLGELVRTEIARTLAEPSPEEIEEEVRFLIEALGRS